MQYFVIFFKQCLLSAPALDFPEFCCLAHLELYFPSFNSILLMDLLHNCPVLRILRSHNWKVGIYKHFSTCPFVIRFYLLEGSCSLLSAMNNFFIVVNGVVGHSQPLFLVVFYHT